jgi:hypothetical protein
LCVAAVFVGDPGFDVKADKLAVTRAIAKAGKRSQLALALIDVFFPYEVLAESTAHGSRDGSKKPLDPISLNGLLASGQCLLKFPLLPHETFKDVMGKLSKAITDKCLGISRSGKKA